MKDNREFLDGIYKKAAILEEERGNIKEKRNYRKYIGIGSLAAALLISFPLVFKSQSFLRGSYEELPQIVRMINIKDPLANFQEADYIIVGQVKKINKSQYVKEGNYIYTDLLIRPRQVLLGDLAEEEITLRLNGGRVKKDRVFSSMEGEFKKGKASLLFLTKEDGRYFLVNGGDGQFLEGEEGAFLDKEGNEYSIEDIKENIDRR